MRRVAVCRTTPSVKDQSPFLLAALLCNGLVLTLDRTCFLDSGSFNLCHMVWVQTFETPIITKVTRAAVQTCLEPLDSYLLCIVSHAVFGENVRIFHKRDTELGVCKPCIQCLGSADLAIRRISRPWLYYSVTDTLTVGIGSSLLQQQLLDPVLDIGRVSCPKISITNKDIPGKVCAFTSSPLRNLTDSWQIIPELFPWPLYLFVFSKPLRLNGGRKSPHLQPSSQRISWTHR